MENASPNVHISSPPEIHHDHQTIFEHHPSMTVDDTVDQNPVVIVQTPHKESEYDDEESSSSSDEEQEEPPHSVAHSFHDEPIEASPP